MPKVCSGVHENLLKIALHQKETTRLVTKIREKNNIW